MSVAAMAGVWKHSGAQDPAELLVLLALADWADEYGYSYPSYEGVAKKARVSARHVKRIVAKFVGLGELEKRQRGHTVSTPGHRPGRTGLQPRNHYRLTCVPDESGARMSPLRPVKEVTPEPGRGDVVSREGVTPATAHIRNKPSEDPSGDPSGARLDVCEDFRHAWNEVTREPIRRCHTLTPKRRRLIRASLAAYSVDTWCGLFARVQASSYCRGERTEFVASLDWLISGPDQAVKILEGQYDDRPTRSDRQLPFMRGADFSRSFAMLDTCPHEPHCLSGGACQRLRDLAAAKVAIA